VLLTAVITNQSRIRIYTAFTLHSLQTSRSKFPDSGFAFGSHSIGAALPLWPAG